MIGEKQRTLKSPVSLSGIGLHTGKPVNIVINAAPVNHGFIFKRVDVEVQPTIKSIQEEISKPKKPNSSYLKPAIITFAVISLSILGFLMFKKFCPHAYTKINSKLSSLLKFPQWRPRTQKTNSFPHRLNPSLMPF